MNKLPAEGFLRLKQIIGDPKAIPPIPALIPVGRTTWWAGVKSGEFPKSIKLTARVTVWRVDDIRALMKGEYKQDVKQIIKYHCCPVKFHSSTI